MTKGRGVGRGGRHPIQVVARRTGLARDRIRQWERRYEVVSPERSDGGHRLYTDQDVERLRLLARVVEAGRRISDVAPMSDADLALLAREDAAQIVTARPQVEAGDVGDFVQSCMDRIQELDADGLESLLRRSATTLGASSFVLGAAAPLLARIGADWESGAIRPSHEHLASAVFRRVLLGLASDAGGLGRHPVLVVATPQGATHELGALMVYVLAAAEGWGVIYLGPDLPAADVAWVAVKAKARAVAISIVHPAADAKIGSELRTLKDSLPSKTALLVGGSAAQSYQRILDSSGSRLLPLADLVDTLRSLS